MSKTVKRKVELQKPSSSSSKSRLSVFQRLGTKKSKSLVSVFGILVLKQIKSNQINRKKEEKLILLDFDIFNILNPILDFRLVLMVFLLLCFRFFVSFFLPFFPLLFICVCFVCLSFFLYYVFFSSSFIMFARTNNHVQSKCAIKP